MAFSPFSTFQKNKRFWMAVILGICMVAFILGDQLLRRADRGGQRSGATALVIGGYNVSSSDLYDLKTQRKLANELMMRCADITFKRMSKILFEEGKKQVAEKDNEKRRQELLQLNQMRMTIAYRKSKPTYFEIGTKFDELAEFKLWQLEADRLGIRLDDYHVQILFAQEFFGWLEGDELTAVQYELRRNFAHVNDAYIRRAIREEYRVKIAQLAILQAQPMSYFMRQKRDDERIQPKFASPEMPDELRIPMSLGQIYEYYKAQRSEFDVTVVPLPVKSFLESIKVDPNEIQRRDFYEARKNQPIDPSSDVWGFEIPPKIKLEYVIADPSAPGYHDVAKLFATLNGVNPIAYDPVSSPLMTAARYFAVHEKKMNDLQNQFEMLNQAAFQTTKFGSNGSSSSIAARLSRQHPEAAVSAAASALMDPTGALGNYLAWGATKHPTELAAAEYAELKRRAPTFATVVASALSGNPLDIAGPVLGMDLKQIHPTIQFFHSPNPSLPVEAVASEITEMITRQTAEEWAQANIRKLKKALDGAAGDPEKFKREFNKNFKELNLTYGPPADKKGNYYSRFSVNTAPELEPLREAYLKYMDMINLFEGRDVTPERMLKAGDFSRIFFDPTETLSASSPYRAMPWPPEVKPNMARAWKMDLDPRLIDRKNISPEEQQRFNQHLAANDPNKQPPNFELFNTASKPILFWRTGETAALRVGDYAKIEKELKKFAGELSKIEEDLKANAKDSFKVNELNSKRAEVLKTEADYKEIQARIVEGWKFDQAREKSVLPRAKEVALDIMKQPDDPRTYVKVAAELKTSLITLSNVSLMHPEQVSQSTKDYFPYPLPKDQFEFPRDDTMQNLVNLYNLKEPVKVGNEQLDALNKELFELANKDKQPAGKFVQILTNKPRSIYYVAAVSKLPAMNLFQLKMAFQYAPYPQPGQEHDLFIQRAQETFARQQRASYIDNLKNLIGFEVKDENARKTFDDRGGD